MKSMMFILMLWALLLPPSAALTLRLPVGAAGVAQPTSSLRMMAGFGAPSSKAKAGKTKAKAGKVVPPSPKKQWDRFKSHRSAGIQGTPVFARVSGTADAPWLEVGDVTAEGAEVSSVVQMHKRLILEHAVRVYPKLMPHARNLDCGYGSPPILLGKTTPAELAQGGFVGRADATGRYGKSESEIQEAEPTSLRAAVKAPVGQSGTDRDSKGRVG